MSLAAATARLVTRPKPLTSSVALDCQAAWPASPAYLVSVSFEARTASNMCLTGPVWKVMSPTPVSRAPLGVVMSIAVTPRSMLMMPS